jgi:hypothetical protein
MRGEKIMPSMQNAVNNHEYRSVPITELAESATNPRKRFDAKSLEELAAYVPRHISGLLCRSSFCARNSKLRIELGDAFIEGHITCSSGTCRSDAAMKAR